MKVVTAEEMREIDRVSIEGYGIPSIVLMERAGLSVVKRINEFYGKSCRVVVLSGGGNNGGDGLVIARVLHNEGWDVRVYLLSSLERLNRDCRVQYEIAERMGVRIYVKKTPQSRDLKGAVIVDAITGTGLNRPLKDDIVRLAERLNSSSTPVVAVDIPTGISASTGEVMGTAVRADLTVTFGLPKVGHLFSPGVDFTGRLFVEDIGFPPGLLNRDALKVELIEPSMVRTLLPCRERDSHKGDYGHILVVGGSRGKTGAPLLAAGAALRSGAGLVTIAVPDGVVDSVSSAVLEEMTLPLPSTAGGSVSKEAVGAVVDFIHEKADVLAIGPGLGRDVGTVEFALKVIEASTVPVVADADALYAFSTLEYKDLLRFLNKLRSPLVLTPHYGEMSRLIKRGISEIKRKRIAAAKGFSTDTGCCLILKGAPTIVAAPEGNCFINSTSNPGMATAGTGDVLTGIVAALIGQGLSPLQASVSGVYIHGFSGDLARDEAGEYSLTAGMVIESLPDAFKELIAT